MLPNDLIQNHQTQNALQQEWVSLHHSTEKSETLSLIIKLVSVALCFIGIVSNLSPVILSLLLLTLWLQEAIWKTFQARAELRLLIIEKAWLEKDESRSLQFYSEWSASRPGTLKLILEYLSNAARPTIAYPYVILLPLSFIVPHI